MDSGISVSARPAKLGTLTRISCPPLISLNTRAAFSCTEKPSDALHENQNSQPTRNWPGVLAELQVDRASTRSNHSLVRQPRIQVSPQCLRYYAASRLTISMTCSWRARGCDRSGGKTGLRGAWQARAWPSCPRGADLLFVRAPRRAPSQPPGLIARVLGSGRARTRRAQP